VEQAPSAQVWAAIAACARREGVPISARHAIIACADGLAAVGAGLSVARDGAPHEPVLASAPEAEEMGELQFTLGQGPSMDAVAGRSPVLVPDLTRLDAQRRWPLFAAAAADRGVRGMFSFPVAAGAALIGVLDVYRLRAGPLAPHELANGLAFADAVLVLVLNDNDGIAATPDGMIAAIVSERRAEVHQATGMVAAQLGVSMTDALAALRAHAYAHSRRLSDLATDVLARRVRLGPGSAPPPAPPPPAPPPPAGGDLRHDGNGSPEPGQRRGEED